MKCDRRLVITLAALAFAGCSTPRVAVRTDHPPGTNWAKYRTYASRASNVQGDPGVKAQLESSLNRGLAAKGFTPSANPDFYVAYRVTAKDKVEFTSSTEWNHRPEVSSNGPSGQTLRWRSLPITRRQINRYTEGSLLIDFVDAKTGKSIWRGVATGPVGNSAANRQAVADAIRKMLKTVPSRP